MAKTASGLRLKWWKVPQKSLCSTVTQQLPPKFCILTHLFLPRLQIAFVQPTISGLLAKNCTSVVVEVGGLFSALPWSSANALLVRFYLSPIFNVCCFEKLFISKNEEVPSENSLHVKEQLKEEMVNSKRIWVTYTKIMALCI